MNRTALPMLLLLCTIQLGNIGTATAGMAQLNTWTVVQDPPHPDMSATTVESNLITLVAAPDSGTIPAGTDIGFQSVNGTRVSNSSAGTYFSRSADFSVAIDFDIDSLASTGLAGVGFGIGEDIDGENSAGIGLAVNNGQALAFAGAGRIDDITQAPLLVDFPPVSSGRFFVQYATDSGDVTVGVNGVKGSDFPTESRTFSGIQGLWSDEDLLVSFFLRSDALSPVFAPLSAGTLSATFSDLEVLGGTPISVPEPTSLALVGLLGTIVAFRRSVG